MALCSSADFGTARTVVVAVVLVTAVAVGRQTSLADPSSRSFGPTAPHRYPISRMGRPLGGNGSPGTGDFGGNAGKARAAAGAFVYGDSEHTQNFGGRRGGRQTASGEPHTRPKGPRGRDGAGPGLSGGIAIAAGKEGVPVRDTPGKGEGRPG